jgi:feruloyl esterase
LATITTPTQGRPDFCDVNFIYSDRGGPAHGYAVGQDQRISLRIGLPLNSIDGGTGGVNGHWNGKVMNLGGGGLVGNVTNTNNMANATTGGYVGSSTDSGHPGSDNPNFAVIQDTHELNTGRLDDFLIESLRQQYQWALALTEVYYGMPASRNYWSGCSTGGRQGLSLALSHGDAFDGFLVGAPANYHTRLQVATVWPQWVNKDIAGNTLTSQKMAAATTAAINACDALDGVPDGLLADPRRCKFSAKANICGEPTAPATNCLTPAEAQAVDMIWDGPRNDHGRRIWFPFGYGANAFIVSAPPFGGPCGSLGIFCWSHRDTEFDWNPLPLSEFDDETVLATTIVAPHSDIMSTDLDKAKKSGAKILMWHGGADPLIPWRQAVHYYNDASERYKGYSNLMPWFRFYLAPGVSHCGGGAGPGPQNLFGVLVDWVENDVAPDTILASGGGRTRPLCPYPQTAIYDGVGDPNDAASFRCGGNLENKETICDGLIAPFQHETEDELQAVGRRNPAACNPNSKVPQRQ